MNYEEFKKLFEVRAAMINGNAESQDREIGNASSSHYFGVIMQ